MNEQMNKQIKPKAENIPWVAGKEGEKGIFLTFHLLKFDEVMFRFLGIHLWIKMEESNAIFSKSIWAVEIGNLGLRYDHFSNLVQAVFK